MIDFLLKQNKAQFWIKCHQKIVLLCMLIIIKKILEQIMFRLSKEIHLQAECQYEKYWLERERFWKVINPWK